MLMRIFYMGLQGTCQGWLEEKRAIDLSIHRGREKDLRQAAGEDAGGGPPELTKAKPQKD